jgi:hypothetical protein
MKPVTYYAQNDQIDKLTEQFGLQLEQFDRPQKLQLRAILTYFVLGRDQMGDEYSLNDALVDSLQHLFIEDLRIGEALAILEGITVQDAEALQIALVEQSRTGNARLKTSAETMTDDLMRHGVDRELATTAAYILTSVDSTRERTSDEQATIDRVHQLVTRG